VVRVHAGEPLDAPRCARLARGLRPFQHRGHTAEVTRRWRTTNFFARMV
jgi:hypothetical protein